MKFLEDIILVKVFFKHLYFVVLGVTGTEGQEIERSLGARKLARLLVGREDSVVSLWASGKRMLGSAQDYITMRIFDKLRRRYLRWYFVIDSFIYFCFKF